MSGGETLTQAITALGWSHRKSAAWSRRDVLDEHGAVIQACTASEGWALVHDERRRRAVAKEK